MEKYVCKTLTALIILVSTKSCFGLRCYVCDSEEYDGCIKEVRPKNYTCGSKMSYFRQVCEYSVLYDTEKKVHKVHSGCELINEKDPVASSKVRNCIDIPSNTQIVECRVCDTDLCNSANDRNIFGVVQLIITYILCRFAIS